MAIFNSYIPHQNQQDHPIIIPCHGEVPEEVRSPGLARLLTQLPQRESELPGQREDGKEKGVLGG